MVVFIPLSAVEEFIVLLLIVEGVYESLNDTIVFNKVKVPDPIKGESTTRDLFKVALPPLFVWLKGEEYNIELINSKAEIDDIEVGYFRLHQQINFYSFI